MNAELRHYEIVLLIHPDQSEQVPAMLERYRGLIGKQGRVHRVEDWGRRRLAYMIGEVHKAHYVLMNIECDLNALRELEKTFNFNDSIIRSLVIRRKRAISEQSAVVVAKLDEERREAEKRENERQKAKAAQEKAQADAEAKAAAAEAEASDATAAGEESESSDSSVDVDGGDSVDGGDVTGDNVDTADADVDVNESTEATEATNDADTDTDAASGETPSTESEKS